MKAGGLFVTGTDTDVGKTYVATELVRRLRAAGVRAVGMKPIECGSREDSNALLEASGEPGLKLEDIAPLWFPDPLAPSAMLSGDEVDFSILVERYQKLREEFDFVVVEGAGGWMVPVDSTRTMADLAVLLDLPVLIVAANRLGVLNHTLLTLGAIWHGDLECRGIFLNTISKTEGDLSQESNAKQLEDVAAGVDLFDGDFDRLVEAVKG
ncbi:MAG: dethiobiotin synthase [Verrucomicrobiales bacterium]|nr:dethiobiotin synthase [Verrucomicrobiales bacterium]